MWRYIPTDELYHHGVLGMKWGIRHDRDKYGNLTRIGAKRLAKKLNVSTNSNNHMAVKYKSTNGSDSHTVYQRNHKEQEDYKRRLSRGAKSGSVIGLLAGSLAGPYMWIPGIISGSLAGATISSKKYEIEKGKEITQSMLDSKTKRTTLIGNDDSLARYVNNKK